MHYRGRNEDIIKVVVSLLVLGILIWIVEML
jgi:hypothetical protein